MCVQVRPAARGLRPCEAARVKSTAVPRHGTRVATVYRRRLVWFMSAFREQFFTESLILAQDERWRRA